MTILTIFCCGTGSNSFDATKWGRKADEWDQADPNMPGQTKFDALWSRQDQPGVREKLDEIIRTRRLAVKAYEQNPYFEGEIVSTLATQHKGKEFVDWIQIDGPGSGNLQDHLLWTRPGQHSNATGQALGYGLQVNVRHALSVIKNRIDDSGSSGLYSDDIWYDEDGVEHTSPALIKSHGLKLQTPNPLAAITPQLLQQRIAEMGRVGKRKGPSPVHQVNLVGWSRGAVTCIAIANAIAADKDCRTIRVNIFAVDPVPGAMAEVFSWGKTELPACVDEFFGVYARDEVSVGFNPVIPKCKSNRTRMNLLPLPGMHASVAGNSHLDKNSKVDSLFNLKAPGRIARYWAERCLIGWRTQMRRSADYGDKALLDFYREMVKRDGEYRNMKNYSYTGVRQGGLRSVYRKYYISGSGWTSNYWSIEQLGADPRYSQMKMMFKGVSGETYVNWHHKSLADQLGAQQ